MRTLSPLRAPSASAEGDGLSSAPAHLRVLVVEDSHDMADSMCLVLELMGHEARAAYTGTEGVEASLAYHPDVVLSDIGLPGLDGFEVARRIRRQPGMDRALLVAVTAYGSDEDRRRGFQAGFDHYLVKPVEWEEIRRLLPGG